MRINAILDDELLKKIDRTAKEMNKSRSLFIREASERYLREHEDRKREEDRKRKFEAAARVQDALRKKSRHWDGVGEIRKWREKGR
jgi:metal-responsive CopG/Arc/MetJ family transcriptional regulator